MKIPDRDDGAPDWRTLSERVSTRRKGPVLCTFCHEPINVGDRYRTVSAMEDGRFVLLQIHTPTCPRFGIKERAELAEQFEKDRADFFPADHSPSDGALGRQDGLPEDTLKTKLHTGEGE